MAVWLTLQAALALLAAVVLLPQAATNQLTAIRTATTTMALRRLELVVILENLP